jgi:hypothetical protein
VKADPEGARLKDKNRQDLIRGLREIDLYRKIQAFPRSCSVVLFVVERSLTPGQFILTVAHGIVTPAL